MTAATEGETLAIFHELRLRSEFVVDAGVVAGLSYGTATILWFATKAMLGFHIDMDPDFEEKEEKKMD